MNTGKVLPQFSCGVESFEKWFHDKVLSCKNFFHKGSTPKVLLPSMQEWYNTLLDAYLRILVMDECELGMQPSPSSPGLLDLSTGKNTNMLASILE